MRDRAIEVLSIQKERKLLVGSKVLECSRVHILARAYIKWWVDLIATVLKFEVITSWSLQNIHHHRAGDEYYAYSFFCALLNLHRINGRSYRRSLSLILIKWRLFQVICCLEVIKNILRQWLHFISNCTSIKLDWWALNINGELRYMLIFRENRIVSSLILRF